MGGYTVVNAFVVSVEPDERSTSRVIFHGSVGVDHSADQVCKHHPSKRHETEPPK